MRLYCCLNSSFPLSSHWRCRRSETTTFVCQADEKLPSLLNSCYCSLLLQEKKKKKFPFLLSCSLSDPDTFPVGSHRHIQVPPHYCVHTKKKRKGDNNKEMTCRSERSLAASLHLQLYFSETFCFVCKYECEQSRMSHLMLMKQLFLWFCSLFAEARKGRSQSSRVGVSILDVFFSFFFSPSWLCETFQCRSDTCYTVVAYICNSNMPVKVFTEHSFLPLLSLFHKVRISIKLPVFKLAIRCKSYVNNVFDLVEIVSKSF